MYHFLFLGGPLRDRFRRTDVLTHWLKTGSGHPSGTPVGGVVGGAPGWSQTTGESTFHERRRKSFLRKLCLPYVFSSPRQQRTCNRRPTAPTRRASSSTSVAISLYKEEKNRSLRRLPSVQFSTGNRAFFFLLFSQPPFFFPGCFVFCIPSPFLVFPPNILCGGRANKVVP